MCMHVCMHVYMYVWKQIIEQGTTHTHTHTHTYIHTYIHTHRLMIWDGDLLCGQSKHIHTYVKHTYTQIDDMGWTPLMWAVKTHTCMRTYIHTCIHTG